MKQDLKGIDAVLLDIEGTICPISFVKETLFPYAIEALPEVLHTKWNDPEFIQYREAFPPETRNSPEALEAHVRELTRQDIKIAYLKNLQGYLWQSGYESKAYTTPLFHDVLPALRTWHSPSRTPPLSINIYSSGSIFAQVLLFRHIQDPKPPPDDPRATIDATDLVTAWFDTTNAGPKTVSASYTKIATELGKEPGQILFLSDNVAEIRAALEAGMKAVVVDRPGNATIEETEKTNFDIVTEFEQLGLS